MSHSSAAEVGDSELQQLFLQCISHAEHEDLEHEIRFYRETPSSSQTLNALRRRVDKILHVEALEKAKQAAEVALREEFSLKPSASTGETDSKH